MPTALKSEKKDMETKRINISPKRQITIPQKFFTALGFEDEVGFMDKSSGFFSKLFK